MINNILICNTVNLLVKENAWTLAWFFDVRSKLIALKMATVLIRSRGCRTLGTWLHYFSGQKYVWGRREPSSSGGAILESVWAQAHT